MDGFKQRQPRLAEARRKDVKGEHSGRFDKLSIATKHDPQWSDWKKNHDTTTGEKKPPPPKNWRDKAMTWLEEHNGITEDPSGSNCDNRSDGIRASQDKCAGGTWLRNQPWCGVWCFRALLAGDRPGINDDGGSSWMASVASIEDKARAGSGPFKGWTNDGSKAKKGDLVILFGRGQHVGTVRSRGRELLLHVGGEHVLRERRLAEQRWRRLQAHAEPQRRHHGYCLVKD